MTRKKLCGFRNLVVLGKMIHTPSVSAFKFLRASYHYRYVYEILVREVNEEDRQEKREVHRPRVNSGL